MDSLIHLNQNAFTSTSVRKIRLIYFFFFYILILFSQYLYKSLTPRYPKWQPGDPRHRIFFPQFWLRIMRPEENRPLRPNVVRFECHIE